MWKTGHSLVKAKLAETGAPLAGEMSGHIFFRNAGTASTTACTPARACWKSCRATPTPARRSKPCRKTCHPGTEAGDGGRPAVHAGARIAGPRPVPGASRVVTIDGVRAEYRMVWLARRRIPRQWWCCVSRRRAPRRWPASKPISDANWPNWRQKPSCHSRIKPHVTARQPRLEDLRRSRPAPRAAESDCESSMLPDCDWTSAPRPNPRAGTGGCRPAAAAGLRSGARTAVRRGNANWTERRPAWHTALRAVFPAMVAHAVVRTRTRAPIRARRRRRRQLFQRAAPGHRRQRLGPRLITRALRHGARRKYASPRTWIRTPSPTR